MKVVVNPTLMNGEKAIENHDATAMAGIVAMAMVLEKCNVEVVCYDH